MMFVSCHKQCCNKILFLPWCLFAHIHMFLWEGTLMAKNQPDPAELYPSLPRVAGLVYMPRNRGNVGCLKNLKPMSRCWGF